MCRHNNFPGRISTNISRHYRIGRIAYSLRAKSISDAHVRGDGIDDIDSGDGDNFVSSGRADVDGDGNTDLDVVKEHMNSHQDIFDDDEWI